MSSSVITPRYPQFDWSSAPVVWGSNAEAVLGMDGGSPVVTLIEVFLLKVMRLAKRELDPVADAELLLDMDAFCKQEGQHFKVHAGFNQVLREWCPALAPLEEQCEADFNGFIEEKPLRWLVAYCEGFEARGGLTAESWIDGWLPELLGTFEGKCLEMFQWHLAEEYEHRTVMWRLYHRLFGEPAEESEAYRIEMAQVAVAHYGGYMELMRLALLERYRRDMTSEEVAASKEREAIVLKTLKEWSEERMAPISSPSYDPSTIARPQNLDEILGRYSAERR